MLERQFSQKFVFFFNFITVHFHRMHSSARVFRQPVIRSSVTVLSASFCAFVFFYLRQNTSVVWALLSPNLCCWTYQRNSLLCQIKHLFLMLLFSGISLEELHNRFPIHLDSLLNFSGKQFLYRGFSCDYRKEKKCFFCILHVATSRDGVLQGL